MGVVGASLCMPALSQIEEILVTAQRRAENIQTVPITISAFSAVELSKSGIKSYDDIGMVTPGLTTDRQVGAATPYMRGVGAQSTQIGVETPTAVYVDDVYTAGGVDSIFSLNNIERIEVLKGPQGTLFGRNTTGGLIHIITKDPTHEPQLSMGVFAGNYDRFGGNFYGSTGLTENLAADVAASVQRQNGRWAKNVYNGEKVGYEEFASVRTKLLWTPSERTRVTLSAQYSEREDDLGVNRQCNRNAAYGCIDGAVFTGDFHDINSNMRDIHTESETWGVSAKIEQNLGGVDLVSITSYKDNDNIQFFDQDFTPLQHFDVFQFQQHETFTQEFQLVSNDDSKRYSWILGLYYFDYEASYTPMGLSGIGAGSFGAVSIFSTIDTQSYAAFGEAAFDLTSDTSLVVGLRWTEDEQELRGYTEFGPYGGTPLMSRHFKTDESWSDPTWRVALNHQLNDDVMVYASYNRGFKSGTHTPVVSSGVPAAPVEPEEVDAYEIGMKGDFFDRRLRLNLAAFYYDYKNIQLQRIDAGVALLLNAAEAEMRGFEVDGQFVVTDNLNLRFGLAYLDTEYTDFPGCLINTPSPVANGALGPGNIRASGDCSGNELVRAPDLTYNIGVNYELPTQSGIWGASATMAYNDGFWWEPDNRLKEDSYIVVNGELSWTTPDEKYRVRLFGKNIFDEDYSIYSAEATYGDNDAPAPPRTWGVGFDAKVF
ncbi:MAG: TonB-dependent receptor [Porticoccaceae bacterium]